MRGLDSSDAQISQPSVLCREGTAFHEQGKPEGRMRGAIDNYVLLRRHSPLVWADRCRAVWNCILFLLLGKPHLEIKKKFNCKV